MTEPSPSPTDAADRPASVPSTSSFGSRVWIGLGLTATLAALAIATDRLPVPPFQVVQDDGTVRHPIGAAIIAILLGALARNLLPLPAATSVGTRWIIRRVIPVAIVLIGAGLNLAVVRDAGVGAITIIIVGIMVAMLGGMLVGGMLRAGRKTSILLGAGTAICGSSAIIAIAPLIRADEDDLVISISTVNLLGLIAMLALPVIGGVLEMSGPAFGVWAGSTVHAVPQAVAAGFAYPAEGHPGEIATLVKLVRVAMLAPLVLVISLAATHARGGLRTVKWPTIVPWFIWGFLLLAVARTTFGGEGLMGTALTWLKDLGGLLFVLSMAALGLEVDLRQLTSVGGRAVAAGAIIAVTLAAVSLALITLLL